MRSRRPRPASAEPTPAATAPPAPPAEEYEQADSTRNSFQLDSDRQEVSLRLSYTSAIICIVALLTVVAAAFLAGRKTGPQAATGAQAPSTEAIRRGAPQPGVTGPLISVRFNAPDGPVDNVIPPAEPAGSVMRGGAQRSDELNYIVIQSYPEKEMAEEAVAELRKGGIEATVERGLPGWGTPNWYSVVGLDGFKGISSSPQYDAYVRKVREISERLHGKKGSFKAFDPRPYKWGKQR